MQVKKQQLELDMKQWTGSKLGKEYIKPVYCHPVYLTYSEYIMQNARLDEAQAGIKIARRNINKLRYADDTTLMVESEEELKSLLMKVKEYSENAGLNSAFKKTKIIGIQSHHFMANRKNRKMETVADFIFLDSKITWHGGCSHEIQKLPPWKKSYDKHR